VKEVDLAVEDDPFPLARQIARQLHGAFVPLDTQFGIARVVVKRTSGILQYDFARFKGNSIGEDLRLRDFSINALGLDLTAALSQDTSQLLDPTAGLPDLERRSLRHCYESAFDDDPLRMLRAFRIAAQLDFQVAAETEEKIRSHTGQIGRVAPERITEELLRLLATSSASRTIEKTLAVGLLWDVLPEVARSPLPDLTRLKRMEDILANLGGDARPPSFRSYVAEPAVFCVCQSEILKLAALLLDLEWKPGPKPSFERLRLSSRDSVAVSQLVSGARDAPWRKWGIVTEDLTVYRFFRDHAPHGPGIVLLGLADEASPHCRDRLASLKEAFDQRRTTCVDPPRILDGRQIIETLGLSPGPQVGWLLEQVREAQVVGRVHSREDALAFARKLDPIGGRSPKT